MTTDPLDAMPDAMPDAGPAVLDGDGALSPPEPGYLNLLRVRAALFWLPVLTVAIVADRLLLADQPVAGLLPLLAGLLAVLGILIAPRRIYRRLGYHVGDGLLRAVRGWIVHIDTIVPFVRVQHIDVSRGPLDKMFGTASLIVHTAGTHNSVVTVPGLDPRCASDIRDQIRTTIRTDFE